jgi:hypothetical protein
LHAQAASIVAYDFFTVESLFLRRYYALFFIAHGDRRVWGAGCTANPTGAWVTEQARNLGPDFSDQGVRFLIRDRDNKYSGPFDQVFRNEGIRIVKTPVAAPKANAIAERFVRTVRAECLDWLLILNRRHLEVVPRTYVAHYNRKRPHRAWGSETLSRCPIPRISSEIALASPTAVPILLRRSILSTRRSRQRLPRLGRLRSSEPALPGLFAIGPGGVDPLRIPRTRNGA